MSGIRMRLLGGGAALAVALTMAVVGTSAQAATVQWNPQNTVEPATIASGSSLTVTDNLGNKVICKTLTGNTLAPINGNPAVAGTVNSSGAAAPPQFTNCTNTFLPSDTTTVTASGQWLFTATSTTTVDGSQASVKVNIGGVCTVTVTNAAVPGNAWSNSTHQATLNGNVSVPISESGLCDGATSATMSGVLQLPNTVTIS